MEADVIYRPNEKAPPLFALPSDPNVAAVDRERLTGQNAVILDRLRRGPATNAELAAISLKYTSRISDLRAAGIGVECVRGESGVNTYRLEVKP